MNAWQLIGKTFKNWYKGDQDSSNPPQKKVSSHDGKESQSFVFRFICGIHSPTMVLVSISSLTGLVGYRFYNQPELAVGTLSPITIIAPESVTLDDHKTTDEIRRRVRNGSLPVLTKDHTISTRLATDLKNQLNQINSLRLLKNDLKFIPGTIISTSLQLYLYDLTEQQWQDILQQITTKQDINWDSPPLDELSRYRQKVDEETFKNLISEITANRQMYQQIQQQIDGFQITSLSDAEKNILLSLDEETWKKLTQQIEYTHEIMLTQGIPGGLPDDMKLQAIEAHVQNSLSPGLRSITANLLLPYLRTNLVIDPEKTVARAEKVAQEIQTVIVSIEKNQVIVKAGDEITQGDFILLDHFGLSRRSVNWQGVAGSAGVVSLSLIAFIAIAHRAKKHLRRRDQVLIWLFSLSIPMVSLMDIGYNPIPAVGFLTSTFYGPTVALSQVTIMTGLTLFQMEGVGWQYLIPSFAGGIVASLVAGRLRSREELALLGVGVGITQGSAYFIIHLIGSAAAEVVWYALLPGALWHGTVGVVYTILALGISPYLERFFDLITPIRLAELSNPNRPLLKRLATEAPGTFQHTMFVASLAEAAARKLGCNVELVRAGTLYHDIGKMHDPLGFIENQMGGPNKHDSINDPWQSATIIKKHVSEGIVMAKRYGLPKAITNFIPEHQGTLLISYFYFQAQSLQKDNPDIVIDESDFRYDGPIPQCRETGIVMLADGCEAALRSLKSATPEQAIAMVNKIFKARWRDHQLDDCSIKYEELPTIAEVFVEVWQQSNHQRISYPKGALDLKPTYKPCSKN